MKKDIPFRKVEDVGMAVVREEQGWRVHLLNMKKEALDNVMISSRGYGKSAGEKQKTSILRHYFKMVPALASVAVETIIEDVFHLTNEYLVSFYVNGKLYDKKYIFVPDSIRDMHLTTIPILDKPGVLIM